MNAPERKLEIRRRQNPSANFLLQRIKLRGGEEFAQRDAESVTEQLDRQELGILAFAVKNILDARGRQRAERGQTIDADPTLSAELEYAVFDRCDRVRLKLTSSLFLLAYPKTVSKVGYTNYY